MSRRRRRNYGWAKARAFLEAAIRSRLGESAEFEIGWINYLDKGICRSGHIADVEVPGKPQWSRRYVVLLPLADAETACDRRTEQEAKVLEALSRSDLPLRTPELIALLEDEGRPVMVETAVAGYPLDLRAGRMRGSRPCETVAEVAAAVHGVDIGPQPGLRGHPTRRSHAQAELAIFEGLREPLLQEAHAWALENLPPPTPAVLVHGDLLGQNIILSLDDEPPGLIDWFRVAARYQLFPSSLDIGRRGFGPTGNAREKSDLPLTVPLSGSRRAQQALLGNRER